ncbi:MAG: elongation factor 1-beta [archaeon]
MATVFVTLKVMPKTTDVDLKVLEEKVKEKIKDFGGEVAGVEIQPVAFGLNALLISFLMDESKGSPDPLEESVSELEDVASATVIDVRRTLG